MQELIAGLALLGLGLIVWTPVLLLAFWLIT